MFALQGTRRRAWSGIVLIALAALVFAAPAPCAQPTGNRKAISFLAQAARDYASLPGAKMTEKGFFFLHFNGGTSVDYRWGRNPPEGYKAATAVVLYWLSDGKIVGYLATVSAPRIPRLRILVVAEQVFTSTSRCWERSSASSAPFGIGDRLILSDNGGKFRGLAKRRDLHDRDLQLSLGEGNQSEGNRRLHRRQAAGDSLRDCAHRQIENHHPPDDHAASHSSSPARFKSPAAATRPQAHLLATTTRSSGLRECAERQDAGKPAAASVAAPMYRTTRASTLAVMVAMHSTTKRRAR